MVNTCFSKLGKGRGGEGEGRERGEGRRGRGGRRGGGEREGGGKGGEEERRERRK